MTDILVIDNYDSFVYTLAGYLRQLGAQVEVVRNDCFQVSQAGHFDGVLVSPGPGTPEDAGVSIAVIRECAQAGTPMLGVCLGHQALAVAFGGVVARSPELRHGKTSQITHDASGVFAGLPSPMTATRYHSLAAVPESLPAELIANAHTTTNIVQGLRHTELPLHGVQFHPESVLTQGGYRLIANWLTLCGVEDAISRGDTLAPINTA